MHRHIHGRAKRKDGLPHGPFKLHKPNLDKNLTYPILWEHEAKNETRLIVEPDREGVVHAGCEERAIEVWEKTNSKLHFNLDFQLSSQPLTCCITKNPSIGGRAWAKF